MDAAAVSAGKGKGKEGKVPVPKQITVNGKQMTVTYWVKPGGAAHQAAGAAPTIQPGAQQLGSGPAPPEPKALTHVEKLAKIKTALDQVKEKAEEKEAKVEQKKNDDYQKHKALFFEKLQSGEVKPEALKASLAGKELDEPVIQGIAAGLKQFEEHVATLAATPAPAEKGTKLPGKVAVTKKIAVKGKAMIVTYHVKEKDVEKHIAKGARLKFADVGLKLTKAAEEPPPPPPSKGMLAAPAFAAPTLAEVQKKYGSSDFTAGHTHAHILAVQQGKQTLQGLHELAAKIKAEKGYVSQSVEHAIGYLKEQGHTSQADVDAKYKADLDAHAAKVQALHESKALAKSGIKVSAVKPTFVHEGHTELSDYQASSWGSQHFDGWKKTLTYEENSAVKAYSGSAYGSINASLRASEGKSVTPTIKHIDAALAKSPGAPHPVVVHRGFSLNHSEMAAVKPGAEFIDYGYMSTSVGTAPAFSGSVRMSIAVPKGHKGAYLVQSLHPGEREYLLPRGTRVKIEEVVKVHGTHYVKARIIP